MRPGLAVTESALASTRAVAKPAIAEVIDLDTGKIVDEQLMPLMHILFPDVAAKVAAYLNRWVSELD